MIENPIRPDGLQPVQYKDELIRLSEKIVDHIEAIENADDQIDAHKIREASRQLHHIGDALLDLRGKCSGDDLAFIHFMLGSVCYHLGYLDKSRESFELALSTWSDHVGLLNEYFFVLYDLEDFEEAYKIVQRSIKHGGETPVVLQNMATVLVRLDRIAEAKTVLFNCIAKFPNDTDSQLLLKELDTNYKITHNHG